MPPIRDDWRTQLPEPVRRRLRLWLWAIAATTFVVLVLGGTTRLTQSGLSIVDWQPLIGVVPPLNETDWAERFDRYRQFPEYQQLRQGMTLEQFKVIFLWEYAHRVVARLIGLVFLIPFVYFWLSGYLVRPLAYRTLALFGLGAMQGVVGWLMVRSGLVDRPSVSHYRLAAHLTLAFVIVGFCVWVARDLALGPACAASTALTRRRMARGLAVVGTLLGVQIVWGAFVAGLKAGLVFNTFPLMAGRLIPAGMLTMDPTFLNFVANVTAVQWTHRLVGTALLLAVVVVFVQVRGTNVDLGSRRLSTALLSLIAAQYVLGVLTLVYFVPVSLGVLHQAMAMAIAGTWVGWVHHVHNL